MEEELTKIKNDLKDVEHLIQRSTILESKDHSKISYYVVDSDIVLNLQNILHNLQLCLFSKDTLVKDRHVIAPIPTAFGYYCNKRRMFTKRITNLEAKVNEIIYELNKEEK